MAQVSIQYSLDNKLDAHDVKHIKMKLDTLHGVSSVSVNMQDAIICVDYDDTKVLEEQIEEVLHACEYTVTLLDKITF